MGQPLSDPKGQPQKDPRKVTMPEEIVTPPVVDAPTTLKVGDKEYTPEEIQKLETSRDFFQTESQKAKDDNKTLAEKAKSYDELQTKADDVIAGKISASELTEQEKEDFKYMGKIGYATKGDVEALIAKVKEDTTKEVEEKLTKKERLAQVESEINTLATQHTFIDKEELKKYMSDKATSGTLLSTEEAVTLLYKDKIIASGIKPEDLPGVEKGGKQGVETPPAKILELGSRAMSERIAERFNSVN